MNDIKKVTRREFMVTTTAAVSGVYLLEGCSFFSHYGDIPEINQEAYKIQDSNKTIDIFLDKAPDLLNEGYAVKIIDSRLKEPLIIANTGGSDFKAFPITCTHNNYEVEYKHDKKKFRCINISHSEFSTDGTVTFGPADKPLTPYPIHRQSNKLIISLVG